MTIKDYVLEELNRTLAAEGKDVRIVAERPRPEIVRDNNVVSLSQRGSEGLQY
jgi:hypothetical protein